MSKTVAVAAAVAIIACDAAAAAEASADAAIVACDAAAAATACADAARAADVLMLLLMLELLFSRVTRALNSSRR